MFINQDFPLQEAAPWLRLLRMLEKKIISDQVEAFTGHLSCILFKSLVIPSFSMN